MAKGPAELAGPLLASPVGGPGSSLKDEATVPQGIASVEQLIEWERQLRAKQIHHQAEADDFASWRGRVIQSLRDLHGLSYDSIAHHLGGVTRAQVEYLAKGRKKR
jgi:hypothetical protein